MLNFDISHTFLPPTVAKLSTVKNSPCFWPTLYNTIQQTEVDKYTAHFKLSDYLFAPISTVEWEGGEANSTRKKILLKKFPMIFMQSTKTDLTTRTTKNKLFKQFGRMIYKYKAK